MPLRLRLVHGINFTFEGLPPRIKGPVFNAKLILPSQSALQSTPHPSIMCCWRRVRNVYLKCGHAYNLPDEHIQCDSRLCKFSPAHPSSCGPPTCKKTCAQYRQYPQQYSPNIDRFCPACEQAQYR